MTTIRYLLCPSTGSCEAYKAAKERGINTVNVVVYDPEEGFRCEALKNVSDLAGFNCSCLHIDNSSRLKEIKDLVSSLIRPEIK